MRKIKSILAIFLITILIISINPYTVKSDYEIDEGYTINNMDVDVKVNDKREYNIVEIIDVYFNEERHGIIRNIPNSSGLENYKITNIRVDGAPYEINEDNNIQIKIGDEDETIEGKKQYVIKYTLEHYNDEQEEGDYIYLNVLGTEWDTEIEKFSSTITYPKNSNLEKINITSGEYQNKYNKYVDYTTNENTIKIQSKEKIPPFNGVTINAMLNEGAFKNAPINPYTYIEKLLPYIFALILLLIVYIFYKHKDNIPIISAVEFYPPEDMNSAEVAYGFRGNIGMNDVTTLIFYWASQNHIKINMRDGKSFTLMKIKELDNKHKDYEKILFNEIFKCGNGSYVTDKELKGEITSAVGKACSGVKKIFTKEKKIYDSKSLLIGKGLVLISCIPIFLANIYGAMINHADLFETLLISIRLSFILLVLYSMFSSLNKKRYTEKGKKTANISIIILAVLYAFLGIWNFELSNVPIFTALMAIVISYLGIIMAGYIPRRTEYGKELLGRIIGFRNFIEIAEKDRLEALLEEDPQYFYNTLPYAQVLGVTRKWVDKFEGITMEEPSYCNTYSGDVFVMSRLIDSIDKVNSSMTYSDDSSGGDSGGFGGGGCSGGGSGGGGGSSW